jgi:3-deoxy-D-manno-octulosonic acid kinase
MVVPADYAVVAASPVRAAIRRDLLSGLRGWLLAPRLTLPADAVPLAGGRGAAYRVVLPGGLRAVLRLYRRGGVLARFVHETYLGLRPRPLRELALTVEARRRGVAAVEVLAARVEGGVAYRGALLTAEVAGARTLGEALATAPDAAARAALAAATGRAVGLLHLAGVFHADLNLSNILVRLERGRPEVVLVDFDRARLARGSLSRRARRRNLARLARSLAKLDPGGAFAGAAERAAFAAAYGTVLERPCAC